MAGFHLFSPPPYGEPREPSLGGEREFMAQLGWPEPTLSPWARTPCPEIEAGVSWGHPKCSPTGRARRRGYIASPRESHSLTHVARRPSDRARKHRSGSRRLEEACGEAPAKSGGTWQQLDQPCPRYPATSGESTPPYPRRAFSPQSVGTLLLEKSHSGDQWAVPVSRPVGLWSPSSVLTEKSSVQSLEFQKHPACMCSQKSGDRIESSANQHSDSSTSCKEESSHLAQVLQSKLDEVVMSSRDQKIVALVLSRLKKAQRMRELQHQAAVAWEELKRSDQKVHLTLERERRLLLLQNQEQWKGLKERPKSRRGREPSHQSQEQPGPRRDHQAKSVIQSDSESGWTVQPGAPENGGLDKLDRTQVQTEHLQQCQVHRLREQERMLQSLRDFNQLQLQKRMEAAYHKKQQQMVEKSKRKIQESNLSSVVNFQARKVLMDCQAKAEELLRRLSLEQSSQCSQDIQKSLVKERHQEQQGKAQKEADQFQRVRWRPEDAEQQRQVSKRILAELAEQKIRQARSHAQTTTRDRAQQLQDLTILRERNNHILKLKAEKEEKNHIEGIKEAIKKKEQRVEQMTRGKHPIFQEFQKVPPASKRERCFDQVAAEAQLPMHQPSGIY